MRTTLLLFLFTISAWSQTGKITGKVYFAHNETAFGASVQIAGTKKFVVVDNDGQFEIKGLAYGSYNLEISSMEAKPKTINISINRPLHEINISLEKLTDPKALKEVKMPYHVVAGAFRDEANAEQVVKKLAKEGYNARRLDKNKHGLFPVLYGSFATYAEAQKVKNEVRASENPEAWLLVESL